MKTKFTTWLIVLLVLANVATISIFWIGRMHHRRPEPMPRGREGGGPKDFIIKELAFNADQQKKYSVLVNEHRQKADEYLENIRKAKNAFFGLLKDSAVTDAAKKSAMAAVNAENEKLDILTFEHFQKIRALGNETQKKKFDSIIVQALDMMARPKGPGNGPGPQGRPDKDGAELNGKRPAPNVGTHRMHPDGPPPEGPDGYGPPPGRDGRPPMGPPPEGGPERHGPPPGREGMPPPPPPGQ